MQGFMTILLDHQQIRGVMHGEHHTFSSSNSKWFWLCLHPNITELISGD